MKCSKCGYKNPNTSRYCANCGERLARVDQKQKRRVDGVQFRQVLNVATIVAVVIITVCLIRMFSAPSKEGKTSSEETTAVPQMTEHKHSWREATCMEPKTCILCGETVGAPTDHQWTEATYETNKTCKVCGETTESPTESEAEPSVSVGDVVTFGRYEQDNLSSNGKEQIEWQVLAVDGNKLLLLSRHALDSKPYHHVTAEVTWESCSLREWLNSEFLNTAFNHAERSMILKTEVDNGRKQHNSSWETKGGNNTEDYVFLLSYEETERYFSNQYERVCSPTDYAVNMGADTRELDNIVTDAGWWWLRSPGENAYHASFVNFDGTRYTNMVGNGYLSVRPVVWVEVD